MDFLNNNDTDGAVPTMAKTGYEDTYSVTTEGKSTRTTKSRRASAVKAKKVEVFSLDDGTKSTGVETKADYAKVDVSSASFVVTCQFRVWCFEEKAEAFDHFKLTALQSQACKVAMMAWDHDIGAFRMSCVARYKKVTVHNDQKRAAICEIKPGQLWPVTCIIPSFPEDHDDEE